MNERKRRVSMLLKNEKFKQFIMGTFSKYNAHKDMHDNNGKIIRKGVDGMGFFKDVTVWCSSKERVSWFRKILTKSSSKGY